MKQVYWSKRGSNNLKEIILFLNENWSEKISDNYKAKILAFLEILKSHPKIGRKSRRKPNVYSFIISKHHKILYRLSKNEIIILQIFDNRLSPSKK